MAHDGVGSIANETVLSLQNDFVAPVPAEGNSRPRGDHHPADGRNKSCDADRRNIRHKALAQYSDRGGFPEEHREDPSEHQQANGSVPLELCRLRTLCRSCPKQAQSSPRDRKNKKQQWRDSVPPGKQRNKSNGEECKAPLPGTSGGFRRILPEQIEAHPISAKKGPDIAEDSK